MSSPPSPRSALSGITVLDMTGAAGNYAGKLFAEMGADVILVEPPEGSQLRTAAPLADAGADHPTSLRYVANNTSKRSIAVRLDERGAEIIRGLAQDADLLLEDHPPGWLSTLGLGIDALHAINPRLVVTSITPFGQSGPYASRAASELTCLALGGLLALSGAPDRPPLQPAAHQAYAAGSLYAATSSLLALTHAELTGEGQHVDVSIQEAVTTALENAAQFYTQEGRVRTRIGADQRQAGYGVYRCADGHIVLIAGGLGGNRVWGHLVQWLHSCDFAGAERLAAPEWGDREFLRSEAAKSEFRTLFEQFASTRSKADLYREAQSWRIPVSPINTVGEMVASPQLTARGHFQPAIVDGRQAAAPGAPYRLSATPWRSRGYAPALGEDTDAVLAASGWSAAQISQMRREQVVA